MDGYGAVGYFPKGKTMQRGLTHIVVDFKPICGVRPQGSFHYCSYVIDGYRPECMRCRKLTNERNIIIGRVAETTVAKARKGPRQALRGLPPPAVRVKTPPRPPASHESKR